MAPVIWRASTRICMPYPREWSLLKHLVLAAMLAMAAASAPVLAVPPPPPLAERRLDPVPNGPELTIRDTVRPYQPVPLTLSAQAGDQWLLRMDQTGPVLVLQVETPSGLPWLSGAVPGPDGLELRLTESGIYRLLVLVSADAARAGRSARFELGLRLRR
jgi:hypothetical protein